MVATIEEYYYLKIAVEGIWHPDVQALMTTDREAEAVVERYNRDLAEWERKVKESYRPATKERYSSPERESVRNRLKQLQEQGRQQ